MKSNQSASKNQSKVSIRKEYASTYIKNRYTNKLLYNNCYDSINLGPRTVRKPYE